MKLGDIEGDVVEAAPSRTGGTADDVIVDGRIITAENWDSAATDSFSLNYSKIVWSDAAPTEPGLLTVGETETRAGDHSKWINLESVSSPIHRSGDTAWDGSLHVVAFDIDLF
jgi:hypothetical protein